MPSVTYIGKHSKDGALSIYLSKRVFVDEGDGVEPITGIVKMDPQKALLSSTSGIFVTVSCYFIYECYEFDVEIIDYTIYERSIQLYPRTDENLPKVKNSKLILPDDHHFPYEFKLPLGLPPSITLNPGFVYFGRPIGISYEVSAHIGSLNASGVNDLKRSRVALRFVKNSYFPLLRDIKPSQTGEKVFLGSSKPLSLTASLDREIYKTGQPILVTVEITNFSNHDVRGIRISAKQVVTARIHSGDKEKYKCQVAILESSRGCPIGKGDHFKHTFSITPQILMQETYHVAQSGRLNMSETPELAPSTRSEEAPKDRKGLSINYYVNVHCEVSLSKDLIVKIPFTISANEGKEEVATKPEKEEVKESKPFIPPPEMEALVKQLVSRGFDSELSFSALKMFKMDFEKAFDWLKNHADEAEPKVTQPDNLLISFEDADPRGMQGQSAESDTKPSSTGISLLDDVSKAYEITAFAKSDIISTQAAAAQGLLHSLPAQPNEIQSLLNTINYCGTKLQEFTSELSSYDSSATYTIATETASQFKVVSLVVKTIASHTNNSRVQQSFLNIMGDILDKFLMLLNIAKQLISSPTNYENRKYLMNLVDTISRLFIQLKSVMIGGQEIDVAISTINAAISELSYSSTATFDAEKLQQSLDSLNSNASQLSQVFQKFGAATSSTSELAEIADKYRVLLPAILSNGKSILSQMSNEQAQQALLSILQNAAATNVQLLVTAKEMNLSPNDQALRNRLETRAREVIEAMKKLLQASNALQTQLKNVGPTPPTTRVSQPTPQSTQPVQQPVSQPTGQPPKPFKPGAIARRDSFDEFIVHRVGSQPSPTVAVKDSDEFSAPIAHAVQEVDTAIKSILSARAKPRRQSMFANEQKTGPSPILDSTFAITQAASRLATSANERYKEILILRQTFSASPDDGWRQAFAKAVSNFSSAITQLVNTSISLSAGKGEIHSIVISSNSVSTFSAILIEASKFPGSVNSPTQQSIITNANEVMKQANKLVSVVTNTDLSDSSQIPKTKDDVEQLENDFKLTKIEESIERQMSRDQLDFGKKPQKNYDSE